RVLCMAVMLLAVLNLATCPIFGVHFIIQGSGGIRKIRWNGSGRGKRGGSRIIYYWAVHKDIIYMLFAYAKYEHSDLTKEQLSTLRKLVEKELGNE
ncbi:MAG: type II toxin-antitoxin system RelE/ParE family toxin, partial [Candidatus Thiosymbion ectosymbiont of Robbea hypermnestra]|nr:type II toxin-antitoxin system RelE/ParE family toxin [Candidatus Thiosymbion ectosymbiont of Robbea hypermnestra]